ncbi:MAG: PAS domain S-box protein, partial [Thermodesulfobacteriota bacterium]
LVKVSRVESAGRPTALSVVVDLGERKAAQEALQESEEKYRAMMEALADPVYICSPDFKVTYMNPAMVRRAGREAVGEPCHLAVHGLDRRCPWCVHDQVQRGHRTEMMVVSPLDGRFYHVSNSPLRHLDGSVSKLSIFHDVTERMKTEEERAQLAAVVEQAVEGVIITEPDLTILYVNTSFEKMFGYSRDEVVGRRMTEVLRPGLTGAETARALSETLAEGGTWSGRLPNWTRDGSSVEVEMTISGLRDETGRLVNYVGRCRDVTRVALLEKQLRQAQKMEAIGTLAGGIAHDFNNILQSIMLNVEIALTNPGDAGQVRGGLAQALEGCRRAKDLVKQILTFSRQREEERKPIKAGVIVKEGLKLLRSSLPTTIEIRQSLNTTSDTILADPTQVHQILMNLCTNAAYAMREGGGVLDVRLEPADLGPEAVAGRPDLKPGPYIRLSVGDTGVGMSRPILERIFDPFFTTKPRGEGTGMGLAVVHGLVRSHEGSIKVESAPGQGAHFEILLPRVQLTAAPEAVEYEPPPRGDERILLVDDEETIVDSLGRILTRLGYEVAGATSSREALHLFEADPQRFDLVITDMTMPEITGDRLAGRLLELRPDLPVILCTGFSEKMSPEKARSLGIREFVMKPVVAREMARTIRRILEPET